MSKKYYKTEGVRTREGYKYYIELKKFSEYLIKTELSGYQELLVDDHIDNILSLCK